METLLLILIVAVAADVFIQLLKLDAVKRFDAKLSSLIKSIEDPNEVQPLVFRQVFDKIDASAGRNDRWFTAQVQAAEGLQKSLSVIETKISGLEAIARDTLKVSQDVEQGLVLLKPTPKSRRK